MWGDWDASFSLAVADFFRLLSVDRDPFPYVPRNFSSPALFHFRLIVLGGSFVLASTGSDSASDCPRSPASSGSDSDSSSLSFQNQIASSSVLSSLLVCSPSFSVLFLEPWSLRPSVSFSVSVPVSFPVSFHSYR